MMKKLFVEPFLEIVNIPSLAYTLEDSMNVANPDEDPVTPDKGVVV